jgi:hypothetical protein
MDQKHIATPESGRRQCWLGTRSHGRCEACSASIRYPAVEVRIVKLRARGSGNLKIGKTLGIGTGLVLCSECSKEYLGSL